MSLPDVAPANRKSKAAPPDSTNQEVAYLKSLTEKQQPVAIKLVDGETVRGWIEYYDRNMLRLTRDGEPNLFIFKPQVAYIAESVSSSLLASSKPARD